MNKPRKCKNCQWYGKPYWSIINPCDNCPYEEINTTITIDNKKIINDFVNDKNFTIIFNYVSEPYEKTIIEQDKEIARLNKIIDELEKYLILKKDNAYELENPKKSKLKPYGVEKDMYHISYCRYYEILDKLNELKEEGKE